MKYMMGEAEDLENQRKEDDAEADKFREEIDAIPVAPEDEVEDEDDDSDDEDSDDDDDEEFDEDDE